MAVIYLDHYSLVPDAQPLTSLNQKQWRLNTFCLVSDDETKFDWPDYFLQAEDSYDRNAWVENLQTHVSQSKTVLEKWLERLDLPQQQDDMQDVASLYSRTGSEKLTARLTSSYQQEHRSFNDSVILPSPQQSLKKRTSVESLRTFTTNSSENNNKERRPSETPSRLFSSKIFSWNKSKPLSPSTISETNSLNINNMESNSSEMINTPSTSLKPVESPIIHPSEYNHDDDHIHRIFQAPKPNDNVYNSTAKYYYSEQNMYQKETNLLI